MQEVMKGGQAVPAAKTEAFRGAGGVQAQCVYLRRVTLVL